MVNLIKRVGIKLTRLTTHKKLKEKDSAKEVGVIYIVEQLKQCREQEDKLNDS